MKDRKRGSVFGNGFRPSPAAKAAPPPKGDKERRILRQKKKGYSI